MSARGERNVGDIYDICDIYDIYTFSYIYYIKDYLKCLCENISYLVEKYSRAISETL